MDFSHHNQLVIEVGLEHFCFAVHNKTEDTITCYGASEIDSLKPIEPQIDRIFQQFDALQASYPEVLVLHNNSWNTIVAKELFDKNALGHYLQYTTKIYPTDYFDFDELEVIDAMNVYVPFVIYNNYFIDKFGTFSYKHISTKTIEYSLKNADQTEKMFVFVREKEMEMVVARKEQLLFYNSFQYTTKEDFVYYILFVMEQLEQHPNTMEVILYGDFNVFSEYYELAYKYIRNVKIFDHSTEAMKRNVSVEDLQKHFICFTP